MPQKHDNMIVSRENAGWKHIGKKRLNAADPDETEPVNLFSDSDYSKLLSAQKCVDEENAQKCVDIPSPAIVDQMMPPGSVASVTGILE